MAVVGHALFEMHHATFARRGEHGLAVRALGPEAGQSGDVLFDEVDLLVGHAHHAVDGEHAATATAAEGRVFEVVLEDDYISRDDFERDGWDLVAGDAPLLLRLLDVRFKRLGVLVAAAVAARDHAQAAGVAGQVVEVEGDLDVAYFLLVAVGVPPGVAGVVVAVGTAVVEVVAEQAGEQPLNARIVEQRAEALVLIDEGHNAGAPFAVVRLAVVAPAALGPDLLEGVDDFVDTVGHQAPAARGSRRCRKS